MCVDGVFLTQLGNGPKVVLVCTAGHRDILALRDGFKWERFNLHMDPPDPFVPRNLRRGVRERIDYAGAVSEPLDEGSVVEGEATGVVPPDDVSYDGKSVFTVHPL